MYNNHVDSFDENCWCDLIDYSSFLDDGVPTADLYGNDHQLSQNFGVSMDVALSEITSQVSRCEERECSTERGRTDPYGQPGTKACRERMRPENLNDRGNPYGRAGTKACRERMRREKLNNRFAELSSILEPGRPVKTDKLAILGDAVRLLNQFKNESQEYTGLNKRLMEEIKILKSEKMELREEKAKLKADKEKIEQQLKTVNLSPTGFTAAHPTVYQAEVNKFPMFPSYGFVPMWQYLPSSVRDTSQDHKLRPPAA